MGLNHASSRGIDRTPARIPRAVWGVVLVCLGVNLAIGCAIAVWRPAYLGDYGLADNPDGVEYVRLGRNLLLEGQYSRSTRPPYQPDMLRTPVYPVFAGSLDILGRSGAIYAAHVALHAGTCVLLFLLARRLFGSRAAFWAAMFMATDLMVVIGNFQPLSESLFVFLLLASLTVVLPVVLTPERVLRPTVRLTVGGLLLGLTILTRPAALYLPLVLAATTLMLAWPQRRLRPAAWQAGGLLAAAMLLPGFWIARNAVVFSLPKLTSVEANNLVYFVGAGAYQFHEGVSLEEAQARIAAEFQILPYVKAQNPHVFGLDVCEIDRQLERVKWKALGKYPGELLVASVLAIAKAGVSHATPQLAGMLGQAWIAPGTAALAFHPLEALGRLAHNAPLLTLAFLWQTMHVLVAHVLAVLGLAAGLRNRALRPAVFVLLAVLGYLYLTVALFGLEAYCRCRIPLLPLLYAFAGLGWPQLRACRLAPASASSQRTTLLEIPAMDPRNLP